MRVRRPQSDLELIEVGFPRLVGESKGYHEQNVLDQGSKIGAVQVRKEKVECQTRTPGEEI